ncbi:MAG: sugar transferase [Lachnospiraceae bacterium]|nr:sugar transferase [Lachnospiraceae bacterium]
MRNRKKQYRTDMPKNVKPANPIYRDHIKRIISIIICIPVFILAIIPMIITAILIKIDSPGPVLFRQKRLGLGGKEFEMLKFRSMCVGAEHTGSGVYSGAGDARVTKVGRIIRATSIDELPQLINILRGDMSLIGPRPPLTYHPWPIEEYTEEQKHMFDVRPGITGWAQTHGRKDVEWHHRIELNRWYVDHVSFFLDLRIFFRTIFKVLSNADNKNIGETLKKE